MLHEKVILETFPGSVIFFRPKDIVSGDFFWSSALNSKGYFYIAVCDSTGHGVPGAFMSLLNTNFLNEAINEKEISDPDKVFDYIREKLISTIGKENQKDGFDGTLIRIDTKARVIDYASANNSPLLVRSGSGETLPYDKMPVGEGQKASPFNIYKIQLQKNDILYLYTDGYADQFGGPDNKKFMAKKLRELLISISSDSGLRQKEILETSFDSWKSNNEQVDDVTIIGIRF